MALLRPFASFFGKTSAGGCKNHRNRWFLHPPALILPKNDAKNQKIKKTKNLINVVCYEVRESHFSYQSSNIWYVKKNPENFSITHIWDRFSRILGFSCTKIPRKSLKIWNFRKITNFKMRFFGHPESEFDEICFFGQV